MYVVLLYFSFKNAVVSLHWRNNMCAESAASTVE